MKKRTTIVITIALIITAACGKTPETKVTAQEFSAKGKIVSIDSEKGAATIDHEEIKGLMSAMTMTFQVKDKKLLAGIGTGDKVDFTLQRDGGKNLLTALTMTAKAAANGAEVYKQTCVKCHGEKGEGARKGIPLIEGHALGHPREEFLEQVKEGGKKMPSFGDKLTKEQIEAVVDYVRDDIQKGLRTEPVGGHKH